MAVALHYRNTHDNTYRVSVTFDTAPPNQPDASEKPPKQTGPNQVNVWNETLGDWEIHHDFRGVAHWHTTTREKKDDWAIGALPGAEWTLLEPLKDANGNLVAYQKFDTDPLHPTQKIWQPDEASERVALEAVATNLINAKAQATIEDGFVSVATGFRYDGKLHDQINLYGICALKKNADCPCWQVDAQKVRIQGSKAHRPHTAKQLDDVLAEYVANKSVILKKSLVLKNALSALSMVDLRGYGASLQARWDAA